MRKVPAAKVVTALEASESPLPPQVQQALGDLVGAAREGLLALSVGVGLGVVHELMEAEVTEVVGPKGKHNPDRVAKRHGHEDGSMTLGGRRVPGDRCDRTLDRALVKRLRRRVLARAGYRCEVCRGRCALPGDGRGEPAGTPRARCAHRRRRRRPGQPPRGVRHYVLVERAA